MFPCLSDFEARVRARADVVGVVYTGSLGRGTFDRFSDLDIHVWFDDGEGDRVPGFRDVMSWLGTVQFVYARGGGLATGFVGPEWRRVDLYLGTGTAIGPQPDLVGGRVVEDRGGRLAAAVAASTSEPLASAAPERARALIESAIDSQIYLALHNARGATWSALGEVSHVCLSLYELLAALRGRCVHGFRLAESVLAAHEQVLMTAAWPVAPARDEVRRAARGLWSWTRYVWAEAERATGAPIEIAVAEAELMAAVDRIYTWI
jgi:Nucleotidyltransferase domain